jgi:hypothetical protein
VRAEFEQACREKTRRRWKEERRSSRPAAGKEKGCSQIAGSNMANIMETKPVKRYTS